MSLQLEEQQAVSPGLFSGAFNISWICLYVLWLKLFILVSCMSITVICRWGGGKEDKYFARIGKSVISVYETDTFTLIDKKSIKVENVMDISWSPTDPILALFVPELGGGNQPARVSPVVSFPYSLSFNFLIFYVL